MTGGSTDAQKRADELKQLEAEKAKNLDSERLNVLGRLEKLELSLESTLKLTNETEFNDNASMIRELKAYISQEIGQLREELLSEQASTVSLLRDEVLKVLVELAKQKSGRELKTDFQANKNVPLKINIPSDLLNKLNEKVNTLKNEGQVKSRDSYLTSLIDQEL